MDHLRVILDRLLPFVFRNVDKTTETPGGSVTGGKLQGFIKIRQRLVQLFLLEEHFAASDVTARIRRRELDRLGKIRDRFDQLFAPRRPWHG